MITASRFLTMLGDSMEPTLRTGDYVAVLPGAIWNGDGLYALVQIDTPLIVRAASDFQENVRVSFDNEVYSSWTMPRADFLTAMLGTVFAVFRVVDGKAAKAAGMRQPLPLIR